MDPKVLTMQLRLAKQFFDTSTKLLDESDSQFKPNPEMMNTAQQVAHVAQTIDWFVEGAIRPEGLKEDFDVQMAKVMKVNSLREARAWLDNSVENAVRTIEGAGMDKLMAPLPPNTIMAGSPRMAVVNGIAEHTAHHRGALTVYARLRGKVPPMPYM
jgi:uncharacterized damage-inducible protein DinB